MAGRCVLLTVGRGRRKALCVWAAFFGVALPVLWGSAIAELPPSPCSGASSKGCWGSIINFNNQVAPVHSILLRTGKVYCHTVEGTGNQYQLYDPEADTVNGPYQVSTGRDLYCSGHVGLLDGKVFFIGTAGATIYDPDTNSFTDPAATPEPRFYPTVTMLASERLLVVADGDGTCSALTPNTFDPNVAPPGPSACTPGAAWQCLTGARYCDEFYVGPGNCPPGCTLNTLFVPLYP